MKKQNKTIAVNKRAIVCPPDKSGRGFAVRLIGTICRMLVIFVAVFGLVMFVCDAFNMGETAISLQSEKSTLYSYETQAATGDIALGCAFAVVGISLLFLGGWYSLAGGITLGAYIGISAISKAPFVTYVIQSGETLFNCILERLSKSNYHKELMDSLKVSFESEFSASELKAGGLVLLGIVLSLIFVPCFIKRSHIVAPAIVSTLIIVLLFTMNISRGTLGISLVIAALTAILVMAAYDGIFRFKKRDKYDTQVKLFESTERPEYPEEYLEAEKRRAERKAAKQDKKDGDISEAVPEKTVGKKETPAERKARIAHEKQIKREVSAAKKYDRETVRAKSAMGGIAGGVMLLLAFLIIVIPMVTVKSSMQIPWLSEKFAYAREFVTALLQGDDKTLDALDYKNNSENFEAHSVTAEDQIFENIQIMYVEKRATNAPYYLKGWVGTTYSDGAWYLANGQVNDSNGNPIDAVSNYQSLFELDEFPDESQKISFFRYMYPDVIANIIYDDTTGAPTDFSQKVRSNPNYGFIASMLGMRRINLKTSVAYLPAYYDSNAGLKVYGSMTDSDMTFVNYFDGIFTGRSFSETHGEGYKMKYSSIAFTPIMTNENWIANLSTGIADYNLQYDAMTLSSVVKYAPDATVSINGKNNLMTVTYNYTKSGETYSWTSSYDCGIDEVAKSGTNVGISETSVEGKAGQELRYVFSINTDYGTLKLTAKEARAKDNATRESMTYILTDISAVELVGNETYNNYLNAETGTVNEFGTKKYYENMLSDNKTYTDFVYSTYTQRVKSEIIPTVASDILSVSDVDEQLATARTSTKAETYVERNKLVRAVIDYIIDKENGLGCEYRLILENQDKLDANLDAVENFLTTTKEGYCVQFASAAALLLREYGIPVKYCEGYIASRFESTSNGEFGDYYTYVHDYEKHAWIEVWFDGVGWIQYETTPAYYTLMYGATSSESTDKGSTVIEDVIKEFESAKEEKTEEETTINWEEWTHEDGTPMSEEEIEARQAELEAEEAERLKRQELMKKSLIGLAIIAGIVVIIIIIKIFADKASHAEETRRRNAETILTDEYGSNSSPEDRREMAILLIDSINKLLELYGLSPEKGEFRDEYAKRLSVELEDILGHAKEYDTEKPAEPETFEETTEEKPKDKKKQKKKKEEIKISDICIGEVFENISVEEFGNGMTPVQMKPVAQFWLEIRAGLKKRIGFFTRIWLHFFRHQI